MLQRRSSKKNKNLDEVVFITSDRGTQDIKHKIPTAGFKQSLAAASLYAP